MELSNLLAAEKDDATAESVALDANRLFDRESQEPTSRIYRLNGKLGLAELQQHRGKPQEARATLEPARELLLETDGYFVSLNFHRLCGNLDLALRRLDEASSEYKAAILIAEQSLAELKTDRERLQWMTTADDAYRGLVRILIEQHGQENAWKLWEWYASRSYPAKSGSAPYRPTDWDHLWKKIADVPEPTQGPARLVYAVFDDGIQVLDLDFRPRGGQVGLVLKRRSGTNSAELFPGVLAQGLPFVTGPRTRAKTVYSVTPAGG